MLHRWVETASPAARRGFLLLATMTACFGMAMAMQQNVVTNYFEDVLGLAGPQFGYITAIREIPGFLLIFLTALFYRMSIPRLTAGALVLLAIGYGLFGVSNSFWTVTPWVIISSMGYHTVLQTQHALGMSLTTADRAGIVLGRMSAINSAGSLAAMLLVLVTFRQGWISFNGAFLIAGALALIGAIAAFGIPNLRDGHEVPHRPRREPIVIRRAYRFYYYLSLLDGARQQIFFSFGLWVLVNHYGLSVPGVSALLVVVSLASMVVGPWIGRMIDLRGEREVLGAINLAYIAALLGYALVDNLYIAAACYLIYSLIFPLSAVGAATYLRKIAPVADVAPSLATGLTLQHAAAVIVPITAGFILNFTGYQIPFMIACVFASITILVTRRLDPIAQRSPAKLAEEEASLVPATAEAD
ncbi:MFS transporter [Sphaerobacter sp.]|uniref:MFS transporter n=1 Tax=Sphaerobacter sp. TaxID=2099654 RepID=UPI001D36830C|nr:MFS transporter [Sphaerobacter sp.]MBX5444890.1 MFS transporter [Sphaerobacter sp.]